MPNLTKGLKEKSERLKDLRPYNIIRMRLILDNTIGEPNLAIEDEIENLRDIEMKTRMQEG